MYISKIIGLLAAFIVFLYGIFPNSDFLATLYSFQYDWNSVSESVEAAVEQTDSQALASMASPKLKEKFPDLKERIDAMFAEIEGEVIDFEARDGGFDYTNTDYGYLITTSETRYMVEIFYSALNPESRNKEVGIRRVMMRVATDEYHSWWTYPQHYMAADNVDFSEYKMSRRWCCGRGSSADDYVFIIEDDNPPVLGYTNVSLTVTRNNGEGIPASGYALHPGDELKIHFIPEGEEPPEPGERKPEIVVKQETHPNDRICYVKAGRYYLYVEPSDNEMYYTISVNTVL